MEFKWKGFSGEKKFELKWNRGSTTVTIIEGLAAGNKSFNGSVEVEVYMYFFENGQPAEKRSKIKIFENGNEVGYVTLNLELFYSGIEKNLRFRKCEG